MAYRYYNKILPNILESANVKLDETIHQKEKVQANDHLEGSSCKEEEFEDLSCTEDEKGQKIQRHHLDLSRKIISKI